MPKNTRISRGFADQLPRNLLANIVYFLTSLVIGIFLVPYFVSNLGVAAYGLIPLATSITGYVTIVVQSLNTAVSRFLTVDLQRENYKAANQTFNTAFFGLTAVILLMIPVILAIAWFIPSIFNIPSGQERSAIILFLGICGAFFLLTWSGNFTVQIFAYNRLDLMNLVNIINLMVQTGLIVLSFTLFGPDITFIAWAYLAGAAAASGTSIILAQRICPHLKISVHAIDRNRIKDLCGMGGWMTIAHIGAFLLISIDLIAVNLFFGATSAGEYAIAIKWATLLRAIAAMLSTLVTPIILSYYARGQTETLIRITKSAAKLMGLAMALPTGILCGLATQLLTIWVGSEFACLAPLMVILTVHLSMNLAVLPLLSINVAYNRVRFPGIVTLVLGTLNIALMVVLSLLTDWGYYGVAVAGAIAFTLKNAVFTPWNVAKVLGVGVHTFMRPLLPGIAATILIGISTATLASVLSLATLTMIVVIGISVTIVYLAALWSFGLNEFERKLFKSYLSSKTGRITA